MTAPNVYLLADEVWNRLDALPAVNTYRGEIDGTPPTDPDGRVHAYAIAYFGAGQPQAMRLDGGARGLRWTFQVTCVGGDDVRALWCINEVRGVLLGVRVPVGTGRVSGKVREVTDPGPLRRDDDVSPSRMYLPLQFGVYIAG